MKLEIIIERKVKKKKIHKYVEIKQRTLIQPVSQRNHKDIKARLETNENYSTTYYNYELKVVLKGKFIAINT